MKKENNVKIKKLRKIQYMQVRNLGELYTMCTNVSIII